MMRPSEEFWQLTEELRDETVRSADERFLALEIAPPATLLAVWRHYRLFTKRYIADLALLVSRVPAGPFRSTLGDILAEELGRGEYEQDHLRLYDRFLLTSGVPEDLLEQEDRPGSAILDELREQVHSRTLAYAIGLRGMGGECMCALYLAALHRHFMRNSWVERLRGRIDWTFWDVHLGEVEDRHGELLREAVTRMIDALPASAAEVAAGFHFASRSWVRFWDTVLPDESSKNPSVASRI